MEDSADAESGTRAAGSQFAAGRRVRSSPGSVAFSWASSWVLRRLARTPLEAPNSISRSALGSYAGHSAVPHVGAPDLANATQQACIRVAIALSSSLTTLIGVRRPQ